VEYVEKGGLDILRASGLLLIGIVLLILLLVEDAGK
jgi:hypothetical protein